MYALCANVAKTPTWPKTLKRHLFANFTDVFFGPNSLRGSLWPMIAHGCSLLGREGWASLHPDSEGNNMVSILNIGTQIASSDYILESTH